MRKFVALLIAAIFAGVTLNAVAADAPKTAAEKTTQKKGADKGDKKSADKGDKKGAAKK